jgi:hypothetical protein
MTIQMNCKENFLSRLLPYDPDSKKNGHLRTGLKEYQLLLNASLKANKALQKGKLERFDSLVGENACEIRALQIASISSDNLIDINKLNNQIIKVKTIIENELSGKKLDHLMKKGVTLKSVLENEKLDIELTKEELFIIESYLLSEMRVKDLNASTITLCRSAVADTKQLKKFNKDVSSSFTDSLVNKARKSLSANSVEFVRETADALFDQHLVKMTSEQYTYRHNTCWPCTPMFWTYKVILQEALQKNIPLLIHAKFLKENSTDKNKTTEYEIMDQECLYFERSIRSANNQMEYVEIQPDDKTLNKAVFVVQGAVVPNNSATFCKSEWKTAIKSVPVGSVILAGAADHRQYPDSNQDSVIEALNDKEFNDFKESAAKDGFSLENPTLFFIQHVYATTANRIPLLVDRINNSSNIRPLA